MFNDSEGDPAPIGTVADGTSSVAARRDHVHAGAHTALSSIGTNTHAQIDTHIAGTLAQHAATTSVQLAGVISDETGSGVLVFGTSPTFTTQITVPLVIGGTATTSDLTLQTTSGVGATGADMHFLVGNNGATEAMTILNDGSVGIGTTAPSSPLHLSSITGQGSPLLIIQSTHATDPRATISLRTGTTEYGFMQVTSSGFTIETNNAPIEFKPNYVEQMRLSTAGGLSLGSSYVGTDAGAWNMIISGNVGIGTTSPTNLLSLGGNSARIFWLERHTTANTAGNSLTITAGGATSAATDKNGGDLLLQGGLSTGTGESGVQIYGCVAGATGTADRTQTLGLQVLGNKIGVFNTTAVVQQNTIADADGTLADITTKFNTLLASLEAYGWLKSV